MTNLETNIKKEIIACVAVLHLKRGNKNVIMNWIIAWSS